MDPADSNPKISWAPLSTAQRESNALRPPLLSNSKVEYNFRSPKLLSNGRLLIEPTFPTTGPINRALAIAQNSEIPFIYQQPGETTAEEDMSMGYTRLISAQPIDVGHEGDSSFTAMFLNEKALQERGRAHQLMEEVKKDLLRRGTGVHADESALERLLAGNRTPKYRFYKLGATINPQQTSIQSAKVNKAILNNSNPVAEVIHKLAQAAVEILESVVLPELLDMLKRHADKNVPFVFGHINYSAINGLSLKITLGEVGGLHLDGRDDPASWTVLMSLSNSPDGYWPGRTLITSLRVYAVMAKVTALIFKGIHPHISLGPTAIGNSPRAPYVPSVPVSSLDPNLYIYSRLMIVNYAKESIKDNSPALIRTRTPKILRTPCLEIFNAPDALPFALLAFGTLRNQHEWHAMKDACNDARRALNSPSTVLRSAEEIGKRWRWKENRQIQTPRTERIQAVLDANTHTAENALMDMEYQKYKDQCVASRSQDWFPGGKKGGEVEWVTEPGSSFSHMDPNEATDVPGAPTTKASILRKFGAKPYQCRHCDMRFKEMVKLRKQWQDTHTDFEPDDVSPSLDPSHIASKVVVKRAPKGQKRKYSELDVEDNDIDFENDEEYVDPIDALQYRSSVYSENDESESGSDESVEAVESEESDDESGSWNSDQSDESDESQGDEDSGESEEEDDDDVELI
ncbi:hypothetical protein DL98DRAFT_526818 [Cadophora sp. DSE1049]|nr:hypothetical protein DL98DRAFT_526818 [Cadophora sp. DSE1049]